MFKTVISFPSHSESLLCPNKKFSFSFLSLISARYHHAEAALIFNSGFDANLGIFSTLCRPQDVFVFDELLHASARQGLQLSRGSSFSFRHNDVANLACVLREVSEKIASANDGGVIHVAVESVYSMDGQFAPIAQFVAVCNRFSASLIVDEAHSTGEFVFR